MIRGIFYGKHICFRNKCKKGQKCQKFVNTSVRQGKKTFDNNWKKWQWKNQFATIIEFKH